MDDNLSKLFFALSSVIFIVGITARILIRRTSKGSSVDQNYWTLVARAYEFQKGFPVHLNGKYLMEDDAQGYPPLFGLLLGRVLGHNIREYATLLFELIEVITLSTLLYLIHIPLEGIFFAASLYVASPILVVYNVQLTPRCLGDLFLFLAIVIQVYGGIYATTNFEKIVACLLASLLIALLFMSHKMSSQLYLFLTPLLSIVLGWLPTITFFLAACFFFLLLGKDFCFYQLKSHLDILRFWNGNWKYLGAHQFHHSPIYGYPNKNRGDFFHIPGMRGCVKHIRIVVSYAPFNFLLPVASILNDSWPPAWVLIWLLGTYALIFFTLAIDRFKCFGGGHLYVFNTIIPAAIYVVFMPFGWTTLLVYLLGAVLTFISLFSAWRIVRSRKFKRDESFSSVINYLASLPKSTIAVFPLYSAEAIASQTPHSVLWGGHTYGFKNLIGFYPILTKPLETFLVKYHIEWVLWDSKFWPNGKNILVEGGMIKEAAILSFGTWRLAQSFKLHQFN